MLTPENSYVLYVSKSVEKTETDLKKEKWYSTLYTSEVMQDDLIREL
jgi:hypothetical protein